MGEGELDFSEIQQMFSKRDAAHEKEAQERRAQLKVVRSGPVTTQTEIKPVTHGLEYKKIELRDEPAYDDMRPTNLHVTEKGYNLCGIQKLALVMCTVVIIAASSIIIGLGLNKPVNTNTSNTTTKPGIVTIDPNFNGGTSDSNVIVNGMIAPEQCALSDFTIVLRQSTSNVGNIVSVTERELSEYGVDSRVVNSNEDITEVISGIKKENSGRDIIVINVDGYANQGANEMVIMTNYSNTAKSGDNLAIAINNNNNDIYGIDSEIRCGKKLSNGNRGETSVEEAIRKAGHNDVVCITIAPSMEQVDSQVESNNIATAIVEGVYRFASLPENERYTDPIKRVEYGHTIYGYAEENNTTESKIRTANREVLEANNGLLPHDAAIIVKDAHENLTSKYKVDNKSITTNPSEVTNKQFVYEVGAGEVSSQIAEELGVSVSDLIVPSGDPNKIYPGDKIVYEKEVGKVLVSKTPTKTK